MAFIIKSTNPHKNLNNCVLENNQSLHQLYPGLQIIAGIWTSDNTDTAKLTDINGNTLKFTSVFYRHANRDSTGASIVTTVETESDGTKSVSLTSPAAADYQVIIFGELAKTNF